MFEGTLQGLQTHIGEAQFGLKSINTLIEVSIKDSSPSNILQGRDIIPHRTIKSFQLEPGFGYIRVINFLGTTDDDFKAALENLVKTSPLNGMKRAVEGFTLQKEL